MQSSSCALSTWLSKLQVSLNDDAPLHDFMITSSPQFKLQRSISQAWMVTPTPCFSKFERNTVHSIFNRVSFLTAKICSRRQRSRLPPSQQSLCVNSSVSLWPVANQLRRSSHLTRSVRISRRSTCFAIDWSRTWVWRTVQSSTSIRTASHGPSRTSFSCSTASWVLGLYCGITYTLRLTEWHASRLPSTQTSSAISWSGKTPQSHCPEASSTLLRTCMLAISATATARSTSKIPGQTTARAAKAIKWRLPNRSKIFSIRWSLRTRSRLSLTAATWKALSTSRSHHHHRWATRPRQTLQDLRSTSMWMLSRHFSTTFCLATEHQEAATQNHCTSEAAPNRLSKVKLIVQAASISLEAYHKSSARWTWRSRAEMSNKLRMQLIRNPSPPTFILLHLF